MRILFVDDDPDTRALARRSVMQEFPEAEALEATDKSDLTAALGTGRIDVLVADYDLRWIDGFEVHALTRAANPDCVAVMFTGTGNEDLAVRAMKAGFDDYVVKAPGQLKRLATSVRVAWERSAERALLRDNRELMRQELYHRLHNNLQLVISLMALTMRSVADQGARREVHALMGRIQSLSLLQERFYRSDDLRRIDMAGFVAELVAERQEAAPDLVVEARLEPLTVSVDQAVPLGLVANEMLLLHVGNATALSNGMLSVELSRDAGRVKLAIRSDRRAAPEASAGLGLDLIRRLAVQLDAEVAHDAGKDVSSTRISFAE